MKDLLARIKRIIRDRRIRKLVTRLVSVFAAVVIFMTTYALVLPAITMEGEAKCGMEAHQHDDSCYEEILICNIPESDGHHHDDSCYKVSQELVCNQEEHQHSDACYDEEGNLICELPEHTHGKDCYEEKRELVCEIPESEGHHHDASCYKKVLTCGKEAHTHSEACYQDTEQDAASGNAADPAESENTGADSSAAGDTDSELTDADNAGTAETILPEQEQEAMVPELAPLDFRTILNKKTGVYYYHVKPEEKVEDSSQITDWTRAKDNSGNGDDSTELTSDDLIRVYLSYTIPGGSLNTTNPTARYRLPDSIRLSDKQIEAINKAENGISRQYDDKDKHDDALGAEAIEGTRRPDQDIDDYIEKNGQEYISATVKAENVFNDETGEYEGQDLIFTFAPYTVEKNQDIYDAAGEKTKSGEKVHGWFTFDLTTDQVEWGEPTDTRTETSEADEKTEGENAEAENADADNTEVENAEAANTEAENAEADNTEADNSAEETDTADSKGTSTIIERSERTAEIEFVVEENDKVETTLKLVEEKETENTEEDETDPADEEAVPEFSAGTVETSGDGYKITLDYTAEAQIPENASLSVREITAETDPEAYEACLEQAGKKIASEDSDNAGGKRSTIDENASRFFDIEIVVTGTDENGQETSRKIEPKAEVSVNIQITDTAAKTSGDSAENAGENDNTSKSETQGTQEPTVLHFTDDGVEKLDSTVVDEKNAASGGEAAASDNTGSEDANAAGGDNASTEIQFTTDSFSIYGVVYTVDFEYSVNGKMYQFSLPGGGFISFTDLVEVLGIIGDTNSDENGDENGSVNAENVGENAANEGAEENDVNSDTSTALTLGDVEVSEATKKFVADVSSVEFSSPSLVDVSKVEADTTVAQIKESRGLECEYSAELTEEQIAEINAQTVEAGDWALISVHPFTSEETLTVTMKNGDQFVVEVTDAQIKRTVIDAKGDTWEITVTYGEDAKIPDGAELKVEEVLPEEERYSEIQEIIGADLEKGKEDIPSKPALFDISILYNGDEIEPAEGSEVYVEMKFVGNSLNGLFSNEDSPILVNEKPVYGEGTKAEKHVQVLHVTNDDSLDIMDTTDTNEGKEVVSSFTTDSFSNWLIYLDEDLDTIEISEGDTITLREYSEWFWHKDEELDEYKNVKWRMRRNNNYVEPYDNTVIDFTKYTRATGEDEIHENYDIFHGVAKSTGEFLVYRVKNNQVVGDPIKIKVTNNPSSPKPPVVTNTANLTVNLFDYNTDAQSPNPTYNLDVSGNTASSWDYHQGWFGQPGYYQDNNGNHYNSPPYEYSVNAGHDLKFLGWGANDSTTSPYNTYNSYSGTSPKQRIVKDSLDQTDKCPVLQNGGHLAYLFDTDANTEAVKAYPNVNGLFQLDDKGYYYYNSNSNYAYYDNDTNKFILYEHTYTQVTQKNNQNQPSSKPIGFFPFHEYDSANDLSPNHDRDLNHHFGMSMRVKFTLPDNRLNKGEHIIYEFSGDDDLWVYVDGQLVLDIGGIHQPVRGYIDFTDGNVYVYGINNNQPQVIPFVRDLSSDVKHTLDMFYIERGGCDSNLSVKFNLPLVVGEAHFTKNGEVMNADGSVGSHPLPGAGFSLYDNMECNGTPLYTAVAGEDGIVHFENVLLGTYYMKETTVPPGYSENLTLYKVEVLEDITHVNAYNKVYAQTGESQWTEITETTNTKEKTDITVSKAWVNAGSNAWPANIKTVNVGLYYSVNDGEPAELSGKKCTLDADHTSYTFEDLLTTDDDNNPITYIVREESVTLADNTVVSPEEAGINVSVSDISNGAVVVTNTIKPDLPLLKVDKNNHAVKLSGAEFSIEKKNVDGNTWSDIRADALIKNQDGSEAERSQEGYFIIPMEGVVLKGLDEGEYQIVEKVPPNGYIIADNPVLSFTVENGVVKNGNQTITSAEIENEPGAALPSTGGPGTRLFTILGSILILGAGVLLWRRRRLI